MAYDSLDNQIGFLSKSGDSLAAVTPDAGDAGPALLTLGGAWSSAITTQYINVLDSSDAGAAALYTPTLSEVAGGTLTNGPQLFGGGSNLPFSTHTGFADFAQVEAANVTYYLGGLAIATAVPAPTADGTLSIDVAPLASMPVLSGAAATVSDAGALSVSWTTTTGSLSTVTGIVTFTSWAGGVSEDGGIVRGTWTVIAPPSAQASLVTPTMPALAPGWIPSAGLGPFDNVEVWGVVGTALPSYAAVRSAASAFQEAPACDLYSPIIPALPAVGTSLMVTLWSTAGCD